MRIFVFVLILLMPTGYASAVFYNNTEVIEIGDGVPPEPSADSTTDSGSSSGGSGGGSSSSSSGGGSSAGSLSGGGGSTSNSGGASTGGSTTPGSEGGISDTSAGDSSTEDGVINALLKSGALSGVSASGGAAGGVAAGSGAGGESSAFAGGSGSFNVRIIGSKVREALSADIDLKDILTYWRKGKGQASEKELGLIAASTALRDTNVQEVSFTASSFEIVYRSRGYLLAIIPWSFPVRVHVVPSAPAVVERVQVTLPWYRFFVRKFFTVGGLQRDIDELLTKTENENTDSDVDGKALLFEAVSVFLRQKVGTVADSVLLGVPPQ